jgi:hypothetical protein
MLHDSRRGRPRSRERGPDDLVNISCPITARERDQLYSLVGNGNLARFVRRAIRRELARLEGDGLGLD